MAASVFDQILDQANRANPYPLYAELRRTPVTRQPDGTYVVSTYREIVSLLHDPRVSSDERNRTGDAGTADRDEGPRSFIGLDPPDHDRVRRLMTRHFGPPHTPHRIDGMRPELLDTVSRLIDRLHSGKPVDLVDDFAYPFPVTVICQLLGVPPEDEPRFRVWTDALVESIGPAGLEVPEQRRKRIEAFAGLRGFFGELADQRARNPGNDLLSALVADEREDGPEGRLPREEMLVDCSLLLFAGHETTVNLITNGMLTLLRHPDLMERLRREPTLVIGVVEELLRYEPPVQLLPSRVALADIEVAGTTIPAGAPITLVLAAGSRDPDHVRDPDRFDPDRFSPRGIERERSGNEHLGFGGGVHYCFGAPLARLETQIALTELTRRLEGLRLLADPPPYRPNPVLRGPRHLPVAFDRLGPARAEVPRARTPAEQRTEQPT